MRFFHETKISFMSARRLFATFSIALAIVSVLTFFVFGIDYGIDFTGGTELAIEFKTSVETDAIRKSIENAGFRNAEIKSFGQDNQYLIRLSESDKTAEKVINSLQNNFSNNEITLLKTDTIGPKIGKELRNMGILAVILAVIAILIYIAFRFEFVFGIAAVVALVHDVLITFGLINIIHHLGLVNIEFNQNMIAALLTVLGYSVNDTVIVFDRVRENRDKHKGIRFIKLINLSVNETLSRTINTVLTTVLVLLTIVFLGGPVLQGFALTLAIGIIVGAYSSIFIASSFAVWYTKRVKKIEVEDIESSNIVSAKV